MEKETGIIAGSIVGGVVLFGIIFAVVILMKRKKQTKERDQSSEERAEYVPVRISSSSSNLQDSQESSDSTELQDVDWEIPYEELKYKESDLIGSGNYGAVYYGQWRNAPVAIKKLKPAKINRKELQSFREEVSLVKKIRPHLNVVKFYGACTTKLNQMCLIAEYVSYGSLLQLLKSKLEIEETQIAEILSGAAAGIYHLHKEGLVHRDIAARNILLEKVESKLIAKIADFGLSRLLDGPADQSTKSEIGPTRWMAPESLRERKYSQKADSWAFGVLCWEVLHRKMPYQELDAFSAGTKVAYEGLKLDLPDATEWPVLYNIMKGCFDDNPEARPDFKNILKQLKMWEC